jgi:hypothetical protein
VVVPPVVVAPVVVPLLPVVPVPPVPATGVPGVGFTWGVLLWSEPPPQFVKVSTRETIKTASNESREREEPEDFMALPQM